MEILISPSKQMNLSLDYHDKFNKPLESTSNNNIKETIKEYKLTDHTDTLRSTLNDMSKDELMAMYKTSEKLTEEVINMNNRTDLFQSLLLFEGAVYKNLDVTTLKPSSINYLYDNLHIFSGLYGIVPSHEFIRPYRLDLGNRVPKTDNLTKSFKPLVTKYLSNTKSPLIIDLASSEYRKLIDYKELSKMGKTIISIEFKDNKKGTFKSLGTYAKMARGQYLRELSLNKNLHKNTDLLKSTPNDEKLIKKILNQLKKVSVMGYTHNENLSDSTTFIYTR